jgi:pimeloyl-ACP methyl ester carboxylesterase
MAPLLLLHAATRDRHDFPALLGALPTDVAARAIPVDLLGHGDAPRAPHYRIGDFADAVETMLGAEPAVLYGHSLGGLVAVALAARRPDAVRAVVLEDPPLFASQMPRLAGSSWYRGFLALKAMMEGPAAGWSEAQWACEVAGWPSGHGRTTVAEVLGPDGVLLRARQIARFDPAVLDAMVEGRLHDGFDILAALRSLSCPAVLLAGEAERKSVLPEEDLAILAAETPLRIERVTGEGHFIHETLPQPCAAAIRAVLPD